MSGNRENYNRKKMGGSRSSSEPKGQKETGFFKGLLAKVNLSRLKDNLKPSEIDDRNDFDEAEYFGETTSRSERVEPYSRRNSEDNNASNQSVSGSYQRTKSFSRDEVEKTDVASKVKGGFNNLGGKVKKGVKSGRASVRGGVQKTAGSRLVEKVPVVLAILCCLLIIGGVALAIIPGFKSSATEITATVESAFPIQTFTYEDGLVTMGLKDEAEIAMPYMVPPKPKEYDPIIYSYPPAGKRVALTFDDGPSKEMTDDYIKVLADNNVKATFFLLAKNVQAFPEQAKSLADAGHDVDSHSLNHSQLSSLSTTALQEDFRKTNEIFKEVVGKTPSYMRPPYGSYNDEVLSTARNFGQIPIYWSIDTNDWRKWSTETMVNTIKSEISDGAIILMHEGKSNTLEALPTIIQTLRDMGYEIVPLSQLLSY